MSPPLAGVRVLEIAGGVASGFATKQLAGYGADVVIAEGLSDLPPLTDDEWKDAITFLSLGEYMRLVANDFDITMKQWCITERGKTLLRSNYQASE